MGSGVRWHFTPCVPGRTISDDLSWCSLVRVVRNCHSRPSSQPEHTSWTVHEIKNHPTKDNRHCVFKRIISNSWESTFSLKCAKCSGWFLSLQKYLLSSKCLQVRRQPIAVCAYRGGAETSPARLSRERPRGRGLHHQGRWCHLLALGDRSDPASPPPVCAVRADSRQPRGLKPTRLLCLRDPRPEHWSGLPSPTPGHLLSPEAESASPASPALTGDSLSRRHLIRTLSHPHWCSFPSE